MFTTMGPGPRELALLTLTLTQRCWKYNINPHDRMAGRETHFAQRSLTIGELRAFTLGLSNLSSVSSRKEQRFMRRALLHLSHLWEK